MILSATNFLSAGFFLSRLFPRFTHSERPQGTGWHADKFGLNLDVREPPYNLNRHAGIRSLLVSRGEPMSLAATEIQPAMIDVETVASMLSVSRRHVYTLSDSGRMPRPRKLGAAARWNREEIEKWIADGCPRIDRKRT